MKKFWLKNIENGEIVAGFRIPKGYSAREWADKWLDENNITDRNNYKILYKNPF